MALKESRSVGPRLLAMDGYEGVCQREAAQNDYSTDGDYQRIHGAYEFVAGGAYEVGKGNIILPKPLEGRLRVKR